MKRIVILMILCIFTLSVFAERITQKTAHNLAEMHLRAHGKTNFTIESTYKMEGENNDVVAHVFMLSPIGFVIISADTDIVPVVGYSFRTEFDTSEPERNIGYLFVQADMQSRLEAIPFTDSDVISSNNELWNSYLAGNVDFTNTDDVVWPPPEYGSLTGGWVNHEWDQSPSPYNTFCPIDPSTNSRSVTGCVATVMAQIMHYHRYCGSPNFTDADDYTSTGTWPYIHIDNDYATLSFPNFPTLNSHLDDLEIAYATGGTVTNDMIAALNFAAGIAVEMSYSSEGSGAYSNDVQPAMINRFGFDTATYVGYINNTFYSNLQIDMMEARPAYFGILANGGSGHAIICDGWNETTGLYHLNMGWGGSQNGWYSLPTGMPSGYNQIHSAVINMEGGTVPFTMQGQVYADGAPLDQTLVTLVGPRNYEFDITNPDGYFSTDYMHEGTYTYTAVIELEQGGFFYKTDQVTLDENNNTLVIFLDNFEFFTGSVSGATDPAATHISLYQNDEIMTNGIADASGNYSIAGVLPGDYIAVASKDGNFFDVVDVTVSAANQSSDFELVEYPYDHYFHFAGEPTDKLQFVPEMSAAIRLAEDDIANFADDAFAKVSFIAPFNPADGELFAQIWKGEILISEKQIFDFTDGEWVNSVLDEVAIIDPSAEYFVGYRIHSINGIQPLAWHDAGPNIAGKGGYMRTSSWIPLPGSFDFNLCIKAVAVSQMPTSSDNNIVAESKNFLGNNFPNPFNPATSISYSISKDGNVDLKVYNMKGQLVKTLVSENKTAGSHSIEWNGTDDSNHKVSSGLYFYKLDTSDYTSVKKMIMLK
ncbi:MAG: hypothetical protein DRI23_00385 [Candidatus Cloacimonadota bacterium]|nr:MAG: hypothetical protein DRI23_00385 [Candidatus Cloacimonadota bacterium]